MADGEEADAANAPGSHPPAVSPQWESGVIPADDAVWGGWYLESFVQDGRTLTRLPIRSLPFKVGRREAAHLTLSSDLVSKDHAEIYADKRGLRVRDLGSTNGTFINHQRVAGRGAGGERRRALRVVRVPSGPPAAGGGGDRGEGDRPHPGHPPSRPLRRRGAQAALAAARGAAHHRVPVDRAAQRRHRVRARGAGPRRAPRPARVSARAAPTGRAGGRADRRSRAGSGGAPARWHPSAAKWAISS